MEEYNRLAEEYQRICRKFDKLTNDASQDNASARIVYEQCHVALHEKKERINHYLNKLRRSNDPEKEYYRSITIQALSSFNELLKNAEEKVKNTNPMPPFFY